MEGRYAYPAIFTREDDGTYSISFPDVDGCYTQGDNIADGLHMAEDALALMLYEYEKSGETLPSPSDIKSLETDENSFATYIFADTGYYRRRYNNKAVKKTVSIPEWMGEAASEAGVSYSQVLQDALREKLAL